MVFNNPQRLICHKPNHQTNQPTVCVCVCVYIYSCVRIYVRVYICMCQYLFVWPYVCTCVSIFVRVSVCMYVCVYVCDHICSCVRMYICMYICSCVRIYVRVCMCVYLCSYICIYVCVSILVLVSVCMYVCMYVCEAIVMGERRKRVDFRTSARSGQLSLCATLRVVGSAGTVSVVEILSLSPRVEDLKVNKVIKVSYLNKESRQCFESFSDSYAHERFTYPYILCIVIKAILQMCVCVCVCVCVAVVLDFTNGYFSSVCMWLCVWGIFSCICMVVLFEIYW